MTNKKIFGFFFLFIFVLFAVFGSFVLIQKQQLKKIAQETGLPDNSVTYSEEAQTYIFSCKLLTSQISNEAQLIGKDVIALRMAECNYTKEDGEVANVMVPLAFYNPKTEQFHILNADVNELGKPGDPYIDEVLRIVLGPNDDQVVNLYVSTDTSRIDPKIKAFFDVINSSLPNNWDRNFATTLDKKFLPKTQSGLPFFFATGLSYARK